ALNSISKFKVRVLPSLLTYVNNNAKLPLHLTFALACLIRFYKSQWQGEALPVNDDSEIVAKFKTLWKLESYDQISEQVLCDTAFWDSDLTKVSGLVAAVSLGL